MSPKSPAMPPVRWQASVRLQWTPSLACAQCVACCYQLAKPPAAKALKLLRAWSWVPPCHTLTVQPEISDVEVIWGGSVWTEPAEGLGIGEGCLQVEFAVVSGLEAALQSKSCFAVVAGTAVQLVGWRWV
mmetsp:Transcript_35770/g.83791  ORF Transcript_35770/g.83791 Transcript_35770/m.83791 type:complete len:130 (+) Transcript_35770:1723-2112(+)